MEKQNVKKNIKILVSLLILCLISTLILPVSAASIPNWKSLYQSKVQQIENEYKQEKRIKDDIYNISFYSLQDIDFDGVPELYHTLVAKRDNGFESQEGTEEIYYIKNGRVVLGKIESHNTLGLLPSLVQNKTMADRNWQLAMYNQAADKVCFITKESWSNKSNRGAVVISELTFDSKKGILSATEISKGEFAQGSEPSYVSGYQMVSLASSYSAENNINEDLWNWNPPYVIAEEKPTTAKPTTSKELTWVEAYKNFILNKQYTKTSQKYNTKNETEIKFALYELGNDDIPELIVKNGATADSEMANYIYVYKNNKVTYLGKAGTLSSDFQYLSNYKYPGLYWESGKDGKFKGYYYSIKDNRISEELVLEKEVKTIGGRISSEIEQKTKDDELYEACKSNNNKMTMNNLNEINAMGWSVFSKQAVEGSNLFDDVNMDSWFYDAVKYATEKGIMSGVSATRFDPESEITRAMFVTMLYRLEKEPSTSRVNFKDVPKGSWYEDAVSWASKKNIANGVTDNTFAPDDKITREQLMTILYRYAKYKNKNVSTDEYNIKCYLDNNDVSSYAVTPLNWAVGNELISGTSKYYLEPFGVANRAQAAVILQRFCEKYKL